MASDHLLVGGDDRLAGEERRPNPFGGRLDAADRLDDDVGIALKNVGERGRPRDAWCRERVAFRGGAPVENVCELKIAAVGGEAAGNSRTNSAESEKGNTTAGRHGLEFSLISPRVGGEGIGT